MNTKILLQSVAAAGLLCAVNVSAINVNFIEGTAGANVVVTSSGFEGQGIPSSTVVGPESAVFTGYQVGNFGEGSYAIGLLDSAGGPLSDYVTVNWRSFFLGFTTVTDFTFNFMSDVDGQVLLPPAGGFNSTAVEDGTLQTFSIPLAGRQLTVGIQSELDSPVHGVPEAGSTAGLLCLGFAGMAVLAKRRGAVASFNQWLR